jgi:pilus assembly protein Flp/PilA
MNTLPARCRFALRSLLRDCRGANMVEYMIIVGVIALCALAAFETFGDKVKKKIEEEGGKVAGIKVS